ncbi:MAG: lactate utilization protein [Candidatus Zixiibacteriota bacterium]|nr:MAG: lactate utilization protein [candidate division Zixibacteria bacterium]
MENPLTIFWQIKLEALKGVLEKNNFEVYIANTGEDAQKIVLENILPQVAPETVSWGGSLTHIQTGIYAELKKRSDITILDTYDKSLSPSEAYELRRRSLLVDLFITGTNAVTERGRLVNLDMIGNRVAAITFGPRNVIIVVGRNKIVADVDEAIERIKTYAAPVNAMRLEKNTPCRKTGVCQNCKSPDRICNAWTISEKSFPKGRIKVILINEDLGF